MERYLIDTNVVSDFLTNSFDDKGTAFVSEILDTYPIISFVTQIELLSWKADKKTEKVIASFVEGCEVKGVSKEIISHCVKIRRVNKLKTPDAIIAGTALAFNYIIVTNNTKDFDNIKGLKIINPYKLL
ncbi:putative nucleic acid-binding protein [Flavobacterium arsenatis]|uniref:Nucleic acid-binding protein n=1 Tax=Flavobacterium arsenatis TaxID=1484332 RepID=A0ABU1TPZ6_9FLAO|nr:type II toxin-antitoxin system VapC family toxin [Flavobacterium arsenatis]MDR6968023.1 putative nucleic acid-binding protein [Flavobacterium arsenatis]